MYTGIYKVEKLNINWVVFNRPTRQKWFPNWKARRKKSGHAMHKTLIRDISEHSARVDFTTYLDNEVSSGERSCIFHWTRHRSSLCIFRLHFPAFLSFCFPFYPVSLSSFFLSALRMYTTTTVYKNRKKKKRKNEFRSFMEGNH